MWDCGMAQGAPATPTVAKCSGPNRRDVTDDVSSSQRRRIKNWDLRGEEVELKLDTPRNDIIQAGEKRSEMRADVV